MGGEAEEHIWSIRCATDFSGWSSAWADLKLLNMQKGCGLICFRVVSFSSHSVVLSSIFSKTLRDCLNAGVYFAYVPNPDFALVWTKPSSEIKGLKDI